MRLQLLKQEHEVTQRARCASQGRSEVAICQPSILVFLEKHVWPVLALRIVQRLSRAQLCTQHQPVVIVQSLKIILLGNPCNRANEFS